MSLRYKALTGQVFRNICRMFTQLSLLLNLYGTYELKKCDLWLHTSCYFTQLIKIFTFISLSLPLLLPPWFHFLLFLPFPSSVLLHPSLFHNFFSLLCPFALIQCLSHYKDHMRQQSREPKDIRERTVWATITLSLIHLCTVHGICIWLYIMTLHYDEFLSGAHPQSDAFW